MLVDCMVVEQLLNDTISICRRRLRASARGRRQQQHVPEASGKADSKEEEGSQGSAGEAKAAAGSSTAFGGGGACGVRAVQQAAHARPHCVRHREGNANQMRLLVPCTCARQTLCFTE